MLSYFADGLEHKVPIFKIKNSENNKILTGDAVDSPIKYMSDSDLDEQKWYQNISILTCSYIYAINNNYYNI